MNVPTLALIAAVALVGTATGDRTRAAEPRDWSMAFGSCSRVNGPQPVWESVETLAPDVWCWLGDNIYADTTDISRMREIYARQLAVPGYARLRSGHRIQILGTWDDHDYGRNDAGKEYPMRKESQQAFLDFLGEPNDSPRRGQEGVYASHRFVNGAREVRVILLDTRYHRDPPGGDGTMLGPQQWAWLESELSNSRADLHLIVSSIQVLAEDHRFEKWANFPGERRHLLDLVARTGVRGTVFLSGHRHHSEIFRLCPGVGNPVGHALYDITCSSLTHPRRPDGEPNRLRLPGTQPLYVRNFGVVRTEWAAGRVVVEFRDTEGGAVLFAHEIPLGAIGVR